MPKDLPGLYWDEEKQRYFPTSSRPAGSAPKPPQPQPVPSGTSQSSGTGTGHGGPQQQGNRRQRSQIRTSESPPLKRRHLSPNPELNVWQSWNALRQSPLGAHRRRCVHEIQMGCLPKSTGNLDEIPIVFDGYVTALCLKMSEQYTSLLVGDTTGWLYSLDTDDPTAAMREFGLRTQITSISRSGPMCMVTSLGSPPRILATRDDSIGLWIVREISPTVCSDVWCGQVWERKALVGGRKAVMCLPDLERDEYVKLHRSSDALSLCLQDENIAFMGLRNGLVDRWDLREPGRKTDTIVNMSETGSSRETGLSRAAASVDHLRVIHGHELLVRTLLGDLETHDLRFLRDATPVLQFKGDVPSSKTKLGITTDPSENFLFAGGGDSRLRIWSLRTGRLLPTHGADLPVSLEGRIARPSEPIRAMEMVEEGSRMSLWIACSNELSRIDLGPRGLLV